MDRFFQGPDYVNNPYMVAKYAQWATCGDGPALYSSPTPMACTAHHNDSNYIVHFSLISLKFKPDFTNDYTVTEA